MMILRCCYHQIFGPGRHLPKFADGCYRHSDIWVRLDPHLTWQATKSYVECGDAFGLILHQGFPHCSFRFFCPLALAAAVPRGRLIASMVHQFFALSRASTIFFASATIAALRLSSS